MIPVPAPSIGQLPCRVLSTPATALEGPQVGLPGATLPPRGRSRTPSPVRVAPDHLDAPGGLAVEPPLSSRSVEDQSLPCDDIVRLAQQKKEEADALMRSFRELDQALFPANDPRALLRTHDARPQHAELLRIVLRLHELQLELGGLHASASALQ